MSWLKSSAGCIVALLSWFIIGCEPIQLYEKTTVYPDHQWLSKQVNQYQLNVTDSAAFYNVYFVIRHHNAYHYKNIWIELVAQKERDTIFKQTANLNLADDEKGWLGTGMDDIFDQRILIHSAPIQLKKGLYEFSLRHTMREDPLQNILATGIRVEKAK